MLRGKVAPSGKVKNSQLRVTVLDSSRTDEVEYQAKHTEICEYRRLIRQVWREVTV
jgi:hypothetical protein